jgi:hypothetical protein
MKVRGGSETGEEELSTTLTLRPRRQRPLAPRHWEARDRDGNPKREPGSECLAHHDKSAAPGREVFSLWATQRARIEKLELLCTESAGSAAVTAEHEARTVRGNTRGHGRCEGLLRREELFAGPCEWRSQRKGQGAWSDSFSDRSGLRRSCRRPCWESFGPQGSALRPAFSDRAEAQRLVPDPLREHLPPFLACCMARAPAVRLLFAVFGLEGVFHAPTTSETQA